MATIVWDPKDTDEVLDYQLNWAPRLVPRDYIISSQWFINNNSPTLVIETDSFSRTATTVWLSGGDTGTTFTLTNRVVTFGGRTMDQTVSIKIADK